MTSILGILLLFMTDSVWAAEHHSEWIDLTQSWVGLTSILVFIMAYVLVSLEEKIKLRKSKPVLLAAAVIWFLIALVYSQHEASDVIPAAFRHNFLEYAELFFFLLVAMTFINAMLDRGVFDELRNWLIAKSYSYRTLFWMIGAIAFCLSPIADNLTTALILCAVALSIGRDRPEFIPITCVNIVVAANAGGAFSPFGDITTLMVWQKGVLDFTEFFALFLPSLVNFVIPAALMHFFVPSGRPMVRQKGESVIKHGGLIITSLFILTIITTVSFHNFLHLPPVFGMMTGLAYLKIYGFFLRRHADSSVLSTELPPGHKENSGFDIFDKIAQAEWDTLFFFYGVILAVGGLGFIGYLSLVSTYMYGELGATVANVLVGVLSSLVDNIPVMFAVLSMQPEMDKVQWLLVTLTAGVGGSMLSIGSAAGVALMGQARGYYTFWSHLKWTPAIALGYAASIWVHLSLY